MFIYHNLPLSVRPTYHHNLRSAIVGGAAYGLYGMAGVVSRKVLDAPGWQIALLAAAPVAGSALCMFWAKLSVGRPKMPFVLYPSLIARLPLIAAGFVKSAIGFTLLVSLAPFIWSAAQPAFASIQRSNYPAERRGHITGTLSVWSLMAASATAFIAGRLLDYQASMYLVIFPISGLLGMMSALRFARIKVRGERHLNEEAVASNSKGALAPFKDLRFMVFMLSFMLAGSANLMAMPVLTIFLTDDLNVNFAQASVALSVLPQAATLIGMPLWGKVLDRNNPVALRLIANVGFAIVFFLFYVAALRGSLNFVYAARCVEGAIMGLASLLWTLGIMYFAPRSHVAIYMGAHLGLAGARGAIAPFVGTWMMKATQGVLPFWAEGARGVFLVSTGLTLLACITMLALVISERKRYGRLLTTAQMEAMDKGVDIGNGRGA